MWTAADLRVEVSAGEWIGPLLEAHGDHGLGSILPDTYDAYARILQPASLHPDGSGPSRERVRWAEVAGANARTMHPLVEWGFLIPNESDVRGQPGVWDTELSIGDMDPIDEATASSILARHTSTPQSCWYAICEGHTALDDLRVVGGRLHARHREYFVVVDEVTATDKELNGISPSMWWPEDRAWCVSSDEDLMATYVGGTEECISAIVDNPDLEAFRVHADDGIAWDSDKVNPKPPNYLRRF